MFLICSPVYHSIPRRAAQVGPDGQKRPRRQLPPGVLCQSAALVRYRGGAGAAPTAGLAR